jgi:hypothetical protein
MLSRSPLLTLLLVVVSCLPAFSADDDGILIVSKSGYYVLEVGADGAPTLKPITSRFKQVIVLDGPAPNPTPDPSPTLTERGKAVRDLAAKVVDPKRAELATKLAILYGEIAKKVRSGEVKGQESIAFVVKSATDMVLKDGTLAQWQATRDAIGGYWAKLAQEGAADVEFAKLLEESAAGLQASVPAEAAKALDLAKILELIKLILDLLSKLPHDSFPAGGGK